MLFAEQEKGAFLIIIFNSMKMVPGTRPKIDVGGMSTRIFFLTLERLWNKIKQGKPSIQEEN